jgi:predicted P-loop ATPase
MLSAIGTDDRNPYGKRAEKIKRIASFIATSNEHDAVADPTGNRRIVPIKTKVMTEEVLNTFKAADLWSEWVSCCKAGVRHYLNADEGAMLNSYSARYQVTVVEEELLLTTCELNTSHWATYSEVLKHISFAVPMGYRVNQKALKQSLQKHGYTELMRRDHKRGIYEYPIKLLGNVPTPSNDNTSVDIKEPTF